MRDAPIATSPAHADSTLVDDARPPSIPAPPTLFQQRTAAHRHQQSHSRASLPCIACGQLSRDVHVYHSVSSFVSSLEGRNLAHVTRVPLHTLHPLQRAQFNLSYVLGPQYAESVLAPEGLVPLPEGHFSRGAYADSSVPDSRRSSPEPDSFPVQELDLNLERPLDRILEGVDDLIDQGLHDHPLDVSYFADLNVDDDAVREPLEVCFDASCPSPKETHVLMCNDCRRHARHGRVSDMYVANGNWALCRFVSGGYVVSPRQIPTGLRYCIALHIPIRSTKRCFRGHHALHARVAFIESTARSILADVLDDLPIDASVAQVFIHAGSSDADVARITLGEAFSIDRALELLRVLADQNPLYSSIDEAARSRLALRLLRLRPANAHVPRNYVAFVNEAPLDEDSMETHHLNMMESEDAVDARGIVERHTVIFNAPQPESRDLQRALLEHLGLTPASSASVGILVNRGNQFRTVLERGAFPRAFPWLAPFGDDPFDNAHRAIPMDHSRAIQRMFRLANGIVSHSRSLLS